MNPANGAAPSMGIVSASNCRVNVGIVLVGPKRTALTGVQSAMKAPPNPFASKPAAAALTPAPAATAAPAPAPAAYATDTKASTTTGFSFSFGGDSGGSDGIGSGWVEDPQHWQERSRTVEDRLSDALHMKLMGQFVDKNSSALMRRLQGGEEVKAEIEASGDILVAGEYMGRLNGLRIERDPRLKGAPAGTARSAVEKTAGEALRARALAIATRKHS